MRYLVVDCETVAIPDVETYIEPVSAPANYKDPAAIERYVLEARNRAAVQASLDVDLARIVALGVRRANGSVDVMRCIDEQAERYALKSIWKGVMADTMFVTFNGLGFDLPLLMRRSLYLDIKAPQIQLDRFKHPQVLDLMSILSMDGKLKYHGLSFYANRFGIPTEPDITGADIAMAYVTGDWDAIEKHCRYDVETTWRLAQRIGVVPSAEAAEAAVL